MKNEELILLVDDDPGNLKHAQTILGEEFRISATTSGKMAVSLPKGMPVRENILCVRFYTRIYQLLLSFVKR